MIPYRVLSSLCGEPHYMHPEKGAFILGALIGRGEPSEGVNWEKGAEERERRSYRIVDGAAIIPVYGTLMHQWEAMSPLSGATGYDGIRANLARAERDDSVRHMVMEIHSPGGHSRGSSELCEYIRECSKPVAAYIDVDGYSAAYKIASQADIVLAAPSAGIGSIGTMMVHQDISNATKEVGVTYTIIHSGKHKADGNHLEPLPEDVRKDMQARCDDFRKKFAEQVGLGRGERFTSEQAMATEAKTYSADEALEMGMIDAIARPDQALKNINAMLEERGLFMAGTKSGETRKEVEAEAAPQEIYTAADLETARAEGADAAKAEAKQAISGAVQAERERTTAILTSDEAEGRTELAHRLVAKGIEAEAAIDLLLASPKAAENPSAAMLASLEAAGGTELEATSTELTRKDATAEKKNKEEFDFEEAE